MKRERFWVQASRWQINCEDFVSINRGIQVGCSFRWVIKVADILSCLVSDYLVLTNLCVCTDDVFKFPVLLVQVQSWKP